MKLLVLGATGGTGKHIVSQALEAGHEVTVLARDRAKAGPEQPRLRVVEGDVAERRGARRGDARPGRGDQRDRPRQVVQVRTT